MSLLLKESEFVLFKFNDIKSIILISKIADKLFNRAKLNESVLPFSMLFIKPEETCNLSANSLVEYLLYFLFVRIKFPNLINNSFKVISSLTACLQYILDKLRRKYTIRLLLGYREDNKMRMQQHKKKYLHLV